MTRILLLLALLSLAACQSAGNSPESFIGKQYGGYVVGSVIHGTTPCDGTLVLDEADAKPLEGGGVNAKFKCVRRQRQQ